MITFLFLFRVSIRKYSSLNTIVSFTCFWTLFNWSPIEGVILRLVSFLQLYVCEIYPCYCAPLELIHFHCCMEFHCMTVASVTIDGHLGWFLYWIITSNVVRNLLVCAFWCVYVHMQGLWQGVQLWAPGSLSSNVIPNVCFPMQLYQCVLLAIAYANSSYTTSPKPLPIISHFNCSHSDGLVEVSHCGSNLHFSDGLWGCPLFIWLVAAWISSFVTWVLQFLHHLPIRMPTLKKKKTYSG